ncbi:MAG: FAD-binding protein [Lachnospiraceae bacterium]|nr:FAD-binding protein [Lachnospiraceae bacterium]
MKFEEKYIENLVIGSGAAGFAAAIRLFQNNERNVAIITENRKSGTSRNTGSDKQTYYKLSLSGGDMDSVEAMAEDLFSGGCIDGEISLCEAALSPRGFYHLVELGVPFPCNEFNEYMGYKTDHDRGRRATSAGPYTSKMMTQCLEKRVEELQIPVLENYQLIQYLVENNEIRGAVFVTTGKAVENPYLIVWCKNIIMATGGPAGIYHDSVYPYSQFGATGVAFLAGAKGRNLTEWQFGMASLKPRWNVSGTYMQVLPKFVSTAADGTDEREFLTEYFDSRSLMLSHVFMKGYQWPFDVNKIFGGSSIIDILVYQETILKGRKVYLDFRSNPGDSEIDFEGLSEEAYTYLKKAGALFGTPVERLQLMNQPAINFYLDHGVDLHKDRLEIAICAQHNNGGLATDAQWETSIKGLFGAGEVCGTHGVTRPGGSALNSGQVGAIRSAESIHIRKLQQEDAEACPSATHDGTIAKNRCDAHECNFYTEEIKDAMRAKAEAYISFIESADGDSLVNDIKEAATKKMSEIGGIIRNAEQIESGLAFIDDLLANFTKVVKKPGGQNLFHYYRLHQMLYCQKVYLAAMLDYAKKGVGSRGSALYTNARGEKPLEVLSDSFRCVLDAAKHNHLTQDVSCVAEGIGFEWRKVRPLPERDDFFENQWRLYRERRKI